MVTTYDELVEAVRPLAAQMSALYDDARCRYAPVVDSIVNGRCRDAKRIEQVLDGLLDFGDDEDILLLYKRLCRHYWTIDQVAAAEYVMLYRSHWCSDDDPAQGATP